MYREVKLLIVKDSSHDNMLGLIPSTYDLCHMYDDSSVQFKLISQEDGEINLDEYKIFIRFISGNIDLGRALIEKDESEGYTYPVSRCYTIKDKLSIQIILVDSNEFEIRSNIVDFKLFNSLPADKRFYQDLSYLNRLVCDRMIRLVVNHEDKELMILDDLGNELCSIDIEYMLGGDNEYENKSIRF